MISEVKQKALKEDVPIIKDGGLIFLLDLVKEKKFKNILELGTAVGYSAMNMAKLDKNIHIDTIEKNEDMYKQAIINIKNEGLDNQIDVFFMPIEEYITDKKYDFIFVDAAKAQYMKYTNMFIDNLSDNGVFIYDNMVFHGLVYNVDTIKNRNTRSLVRKIISFLEKMRNDGRFDIIFYEDVGDGILMASRRKSIGS